MAIRKNVAMGFVDVMLAGGPRSTAMLDRLDAATPWDTLARPIERLPEYNNKDGRPPWSPVTMLKCLMLAKWNNLSDPQLEEQLRDRISFRKFVGLSFTDDTPDETTFVRFRKRLREAGLHETLFAAVTKHIEGRGLLVREGTMVDATIINQSRGRRRGDGTHTRDPDASSTVKHGKNYFGYKAHVAVDLSGIVTGCRFTTASEHDSTRFDELVEHEHRVVYADSAYTGEERRAGLRARGVIGGICYKRNRGQAELYDWQQTWNQLVSRVRARVEHPFAMLKHQLGLRRVRYRGLERNGFDICMALVACNLKRSVYLAGDG
jgi:IS5 family transposase